MYTVTHALPVLIIEQIGTGQVPRSFFSLLSV